MRLKYFEPTSEFREAFIYSNLGYAIAGHVVERISGNTWEDYTSEKIFKPLGVTNAYFTKESMIHGDYALPYLNLYDEVDIELVPIQLYNTFAPAGGIVTDLEGMLAWLKFNLGDGNVDGHQVVSLQSLHAMQIQHNRFNTTDSILPMNSSLIKVMAMAGLSKNTEELHMSILAVWVMATFLWSVSSRKII